MRAKPPRRPARRSRAHTTGTSRPSTNSLVSVRTRNDWPRDEFMRWLDEQRQKAGFANDYAFADAAGISHSTISGWRNGRQRPTQTSLARIAVVLHVDPRYLFVRAGLFSPEDLGLDPQAEPDETVDADAATRQMISASDLPDTQKAALLSLLDDMAKSDAERRFELLAKQVHA